MKLDQATAFFMVLTTIMLKSAVNHTGLLRSLNILVMIANWHFQFSDITLRLLCMGAGMIFLHKGRLGDLFYWVNKGCEMNTADLRKILDEHKIWIESFRENGLRAYLCGADLRGANLRDANLRGANLRDANLRGANLRGANLRDANLCGANLRDANLCGADLCGADLRGANLRDANLRGANLRDANLCGADLRGADLRGANLRDANLCGADLRDANLRDADLRGADLRGANLRDANLRGANLRDANLCGADLPDHTFVIMGNKYPITITNGEYVRAGCQNHTVEEWRKYSKQEIADMDGRSALRFYPKLLDIIDFYLGKGERPDWIKEPSEETEAA
ncbi:pentapeptide repeat-containing protein [Hafnia alvei]|uniref:pentapeptide repeat-containing protein n=1 Tax=Hafnia alvei TaxID=569 RepID=UPI001D0F394C|nr:pentapeptide repeat-containing protein [Hafnia alvei]